MEAVDRRIARGLFVVTLVAYAAFFNGAGWNANVNFDLTRALVEQRTLHIDAYAQNTGDVSTGVGGHTYSNKAPGLSMLAAVPYAPIYAIERALGVDVDASFVQTLNMWLLTVLVCGAGGALIPTLLFAYGRRAGVDRKGALLVALTIAFGTYVYAYSTVFFAHVPCAALLLLALYWIDERPLLAGLAAGLSGMIFYLAIPAAVVLVVLARRNALKVVAGGLPCGAILAVYHHLCFGRAWQTSVETSTPFTSEGLIFGVLAKPNLEVVGYLFFSRMRGLLPLSPVLLFALVGVVVMLRRRVLRRELAAIGVIVAIFVAGISSFNGWHGGAAIGPRYILPIVPLLAIPMLFAAHLLRPLWLLLALVSFAINFVVVCVDVIPGGAFNDPLRQYIVPVFLTGKTPPNYPSDGGHVNVAVQAVDEFCAHCKYPPGHPRAVWAAFNLGELVLPRGSAASVVPIFLWIAGGAAWLARLVYHSPIPWPPPDASA